MILTPHILAGAVIGSQFSSPEAVIGLSLLAHFAMDAIPHYEYKIDVIKNANGRLSKQYLINLSKIGVDFLIGGSIVMIFAWQSPQKNLMVLGAAMAIVPDFLLFLYYQNPNLPIIRQIAIFHKRTHLFKEIARPNFLGLATQISISILAVIILWLLS